MKDLHCLRITRSARDPDLSGKGIKPHNRVAILRTFLFGVFTSKLDKPQIKKPIIGLRPLMGLIIE